MAMTKVIQHVADSAVDLPALPAALAKSPDAPKRIALVVNYSTTETHGDLRDRFTLAPHKIDVFIDRRYKLPEFADQRIVDFRLPAKYLSRNGLLRKSGYDYVIAIHHGLVGSDEIKTALAKLQADDAALYYLIPGLSELMTLGFVALTAYDLTKPAIRVPRPSLGLRLRKAVAPFLSVPTKKAIWGILNQMGLLGHFGLVSAKPSKKGDAVRISTQTSAAYVLELENPRNVPCTYTLGSRDLQTKFFLNDVAKHYPYPRNINVVLSNQCNLKCVMCPFHSPLFLEDRKTDYFDDKKWMPLSLIEKLVAELKSIKPIDAPITFHMGELDEPLMHPKIGEIVRLLRSIPNSTVHITSNGNLMNEKVARAVIGAGLQSMQFSVDAHTPETYKKIRGAKLEKVQRNVERFLKLRNELNPELYVNLCIINQPGATEEIEDFKAYWRDKGASSVSVYQLFKPVEGNSAQWVVPNKYYAEKERTPCTAVWDQLFVFPEGEISLCCTTLIRVPQDGIISTGNLNQQSLREIWFGKKYQDIRENLILGRLDNQKYCAECDNWSSSYQYKKTLDDGTELVFGESMGFYYFPKKRK